jgi:alginate O-acetyltransferase complex protein AlgI
MRLCGFRLAENFRRPWKARSIQDFWGRWHITVSGFVKDYVFTPAARAVITQAKPRWQGVLLTLTSFAAMMLIALWHGFTWGFFVFGIAHGLALVWLQVYRALVRLVWHKPDVPTQPELKLRVYLERSLTYLFVAVTMMLWFHGPAQTTVILRSMLGV